MLGWLLPLAFGAETLVLERGKDGYWACEDTSLRREDDGFAQGGNAILEGGPGETILIQFRDLDRAVGPGRKIVSARLELALSRGEAKLQTIRAVSQPWTEGPFKALNTQVNMRRPLARWAATWTHRRSGADAAPWQLAGARGDRDARVIAGIAASATAETFSVTGLGEVAERHRQRPYDNHGFVLEFTDRVEFLSSNAPGGRPRLILETAPAEAPAAAADLAVVRIERSPGYPAYRPELLERNGAAVPKNLDPTPVKRWPIEGEELTYTAVIRNHGTAASEPFDLQWQPQEQPGPFETVREGLAPGAERRVTFKARYRSLHSDHRVSPIGVRLFPKGADQNPANDYLEIQQSALALGVSWTGDDPRFEERIQGLVRRLNETFFAYSRFSFAPEGVLERIRVQTAVRGALADDPALDAVVELKETQSEEDQLRAILVGLGLLDLRQANDAYPGLLGGDTRSDLPLPGIYSVPVEPYSDPVLDAIPLDAHGLLSGTEVGALNLRLGKRGGYRGEYLYLQPRDLIVQAVNLRGEALGRVELKILTPSGNLVLSIRTNERGIVALPNRPVGETELLTTDTGVVMRPNPFGRLDVRGSNAEYLAQVEVNGVTATSRLPVGALVQAFFRGQRETGIFKLPFSVPGGRLEAPMTFDLPAGWAEPFVEVDLGREITLGEVRLEGTPWPRYEIQGKENAGAAPRLFVREVNGPWAMRTGRAQRGLLPKVRFLRLMRIGEGQRLGLE